MSASDIEVNGELARLREQVAQLTLERTLWQSAMLSSNPASAVSSPSPKAGAEGNGVEGDADSFLGGTPVHVTNRPKRVVSSAARRASTIWPGAMAVGGVPRLQPAQARVASAPRLKNVQLESIETWLSEINDHSRALQAANTIPPLFHHMIDASTSAKLLDVLRHAASRWATDGQDSASKEWADVFNVDDRSMTRACDAGLVDRGLITFSEIVVQRLQDGDDFQGASDFEIGQTASTHVAWLVETYVSLALRRQGGGLFDGVGLDRRVLDFWRAEGPKRPATGAGEVMLLDVLLELWIGLKRWLSKAMCPVQTLHDHFSREPELRRPTEQFLAGFFPASGPLRYYTVKETVQRDRLVRGATGATDPIHVLRFVLDTPPWPTMLQVVPASWPDTDRGLAKRVETTASTSPHDGRSGRDNASPKPPFLQKKAFLKAIKGLGALKSKEQVTQKPCALCGLDHILAEVSDGGKRVLFTCPSLKEVAKSAERHQALKAVKTIYGTWIDKAPQSTR